MSQNNNNFTMPELMNQIAELQKINKLLEKEKKDLMVKDEESTQLIIKLDTKLYNARNDLLEVKTAMEKYQEDNDNKINKLEKHLENINELTNKLQKENEELKTQLESSSFELTKTKKICMDLLEKLKKSLE